MPKKPLSKRWKHKKRDRKQEVAKKNLKNLRSTDPTGEGTTKTSNEAVLSDAATTADLSDEASGWKYFTNTEGQIGELKPSSDCDEKNEPDEIYEADPLYVATDAVYEALQCEPYPETSYSISSTAVEDTRDHATRQTSQPASESSTERGNLNSGNAFKEITVLKDLEEHLDPFPVDTEVLKMASKTIGSFLPNHWTPYISDGAIHVLYLSRKKLKEVQRELIFYPNGKVVLAIHGKELNINSYLKLPNPVPLSSETIKQFAERCLKIVDDVRNFEICAGHSDEEFKPVWKSIPNSRIDLNPFKEDRYSETLRSNECSLLVHLRSWRCSNCNILRKMLVRRQVAYESKEPHRNTPNIALSDQQKLKKLEEQRQKIGTLNRKLDHLQKKMKDLLASEGVHLQEEDNQDLLKILRNADFLAAADKSSLLQRSDIND